MRVCVNAAAANTGGAVTYPINLLNQVAALDTGDRYLVVASDSTLAQLDRQLAVPCFALRGVAVGSKNHHGSRSERGTRVAAPFYSLIESAKLAGVEPRAYLREPTLRPVRNPGTATLPRDLKSSESLGKPALDRLGAKTPEWPRTYI
jgi:hypothetical protein